ncbi:MAG: hypothetical protein KJ043_02765, partial [Anaerolineae bacterium]|nr:hypothetical protein [Anaerolineae bacterium]
DNWSILPTEKAYELVIVSKVSTVSTVSSVSTEIEHHEKQNTLLPVSDGNWKLGNSQHQTNLNNGHY